MNDSQPIFLQIYDYICNQIIEDIYKMDERIPSVRELAIEMEVNPNTVVRAFERLQFDDVIFVKRGMGYYVHPEAKSKILEKRRELFFNKTLPDFFEELERIGLNFGTIENKYEEYKQNNKKEL